ncbi:N-acetylmuramoyl-L-alanine amidase [Alkaliphilus pronyensis]|uniref:N-acetylmuramoyl-L-alanine amidase n=1 Tax=Alkaliphilus pronyensis TaxID=1482732 RepID=A0A6I0F7X9_9FIRM|nr:peptidoglycan recognition family protein [Alkaliphilus pronyensis]KAB3536079.1 N-acetylmuramoyl-L-alanine amidase [Alkaliphilus pronyensis]
MSNSALVKHTNISPNKTSPRTNTIRKVTIHHMAGNLSIESCGRVFEDPSRDASSNYGVGTDGRVGLYVEEKDRSWCSSNATNDHQAVTIEVANSSIGGDWPVSATAYNAMIDLTVDICWRNGISSLSWTGNSSGTLTIHKFFASTICPGPYLESRMPNIASSVNSRLTVCNNIRADVTTQANRLQSQGIINTPSYWTHNFAAINYLGEFIINMGMAPKNSSPLIIANVDAAIDHLASRGVTNSPAYWKENYDRLLYLDELIVNVAKRID